LPPYFSDAKSPIEGPWAFSRPHSAVNGSIYGNPWLRLLRREVEALVRKKHGENYLKDRQVKTELAHINRELRRLKTQVARLEERKSKLIAPRRVVGFHARDY